MWKIAAIFHGANLRTLIAYGCQKLSYNKPVFNKVILDQIFDRPDIVNGVALFSFTDGWWKAGNPAQQDQGGWAPFSSGVPYDGAPNEEYWGIVDIDRNKKEAFFVLQKKYKEL
jgi:hypothetical protein